MTALGALRIKETVVSWRHLTVVTAELPDKNLLRVADEAGVPVSSAAHYATEAAAGLEHEIILRQLITGTMPNAALIK